jgi:Na+-driven multidrug efflux pump
VAVAILAVALLLALTATPLSGFIFRRVLDLAPPLPSMARIALWILLPMPALAVAQSYFQGIILHSRRTRSVTESVMIFLGLTTMLLVAGVLWGATTGLFITVGAFTSGEALRTAWLWIRSARARRVLRDRDAAPVSEMKYPG